MATVKEINKLTAYFLRKDRDQVTQGNLVPDVTETLDLGASNKRWDNVYAKTITADTIGGTMSGQSWSYGGDMSINPDHASQHTTLYVENTDGTYEASLDVERDVIVGNNITVGGTVDGVDIAAHAVDVDAHHDLVTVTGAGLSLTGQDVSLVHGVTPTTIEPDDSAAEGSDDRSARGDHTHAIVSAAPTTSLTADTTNSEGSATSFARSDHSHDITTAAPITSLTADTTNAEGSAATLSRSDHSHDITTAAPLANLSVSTSDAEGSASTLSRSDHSHGIITSSNPSNNARILASDSNGGLQLLRLGIGASPGTDNWIQMVDDAGIGDATGLRIVFDLSGTEYKLTGGNLAFQQASAISTTAGSLTLTPTSNVEISSAATLKSVNWSSGVTGWGITYAGAGDFRSLTADELYVKAFIAEIYQAFAGAIIITQSRAIVNQDFTIPNTGVGADLYVQDLEGWVDTPVFAANDYVLLRVIDMSNGGLVVQNVWGQVTAYTNTVPGNGEQKWTFTTTTTSYSSADVIYAGSLALDYGPSSGGGIWEATVLDASGAPYSQVVTWDTITSGEPSNFTTHTRLGELTGLGYTGEYGLWAGQDAQTYLLLTDTSFEGHGLDLKLYQSTTNTIWLKASTPAIIVSANAGTDTYGSGNGVWMGNDGGTYKFRVGNTAGTYMDFDGSQLLLYSGTGNYLSLAGSELAMFENSVKRFRLLSNGNLYMGSDATAVSGTYFSIFTTATTWGSHSFEANDLMIGSNASGKANIWWDQSAGQFNFRTQNTITMYINSSGQLVAGDGDVTLDEDGITITTTTSYQPTSAYKLSYGGVVTGHFSGWRDTLPTPDNNVVAVIAENLSGFGSLVTIQAQSNAVNYPASVELLATDGTSQVTLTAYLDANATNSRYVQIIGGGLAVGTVTQGEPYFTSTGGNMAVEGDVNIGSGLTVGSFTTQMGNGQIRAEDYIIALGGFTTETSDPLGGLVIGNGSADFYIAPVTIGLEGTTKGYLHCYAGGGATWGGEIRLDFDNNYDTTYERIQLLAVNDDFRIAFQATSGGAWTSRFYLSNEGVISQFTDIYTSTWQSYSPTLYGWASTTTSVYRYKRIGKTCILDFRIIGTSNQTYARISLPVNASTGNVTTNVMLAQDAGGTSAYGHAYIDPATSQSVLYFYRAGWASWTNSGTKQCWGQIVYQTV